MTLRPQFNGAPLHPGAFIPGSYFFLPSFVVSPFLVNAEQGKGKFDTQKIVAVKINSPNGSFTRHFKYLPPASAP
jgi:hypothetical protein